MDEEAARLLRIISKNFYMQKGGWIRSVYKLSEEQLLKLFVDQKGNCALCNVDLETVKKWVIDHDHETGKVRGILCWRCNHGLGQFGDSLDLLKLAVRYMEKAKYGATLHET